MSSPYIFFVDSSGLLRLTTVVNGIDRLSVIPSLVPTGNPYWLIEPSEIPTDMSNYDAWTVDLSEVREPDGYGV